MAYDIPRRRRVVLIAAAILLGIVQVIGTPARAQQAKPPQPQVNKEGQVTVKVAPLTLSAGAETWRFAVEFDTHTVPLTQDLLAIAALAGPDGEDRRPVAWEGDPPGGHHRQGVEGCHHGTGQGQQQSEGDEGRVRFAQECLDGGDPYPPEGAHGHAVEKGDGKQGDHEPGTIPMGTGHVDGFACHAAQSPGDVFVGT
mgnify:CR=1 FL=1